MDDKPSIDYHIEITELKEFLNGQINKNIITINQGMLVFESMKEAVIGASIKPFLEAQAKEVMDSYYEKYFRLEHHPDYKDKYIPGFFSQDGDYYDLDAPLYIYKDKITSKSFTLLFHLKLLQIESNRISINEFLDFQFNDNFNRNINYFTSFLHQFLTNDGIFRLLPETTTTMKQWIDKHEIFQEDEDEILQTNSNYINEELLEENELYSITNKNDIEIMGFWTIEEIRKYFSFLYEELSVSGNPFLSEEYVNEIFKQGLTIPAIPKKSKYKLNINSKYPKSIIDFSIQQFYSKNTRSHKDKKLYLKFFGSYIEDYWAAVESEKQLNLLASNFSNKKPGNNKIDWNKYLPEKFK